MAWSPPSYLQQASGSLALGPKDLARGGDMRQQEQILHQMTEAWPGASETQADEPRTRQVTRGSASPTLDCSRCLENLEQQTSEVIHQGPHSILEE
jgi:hypothetical protein